MFEVILNISIAAAAVVLGVVVYKFCRVRREAIAECIIAQRREQYAREVELAGQRIKYMMTASAPLACEITGAAEEDKPEPRVEVIAAPGSCVVRRLVTRQREAETK